MWAGVGVHATVVVVVSSVLGHGHLQLVGEGTWVVHRVPVCVLHLNGGHHEFGGIDVGLVGRWGSSDDWQGRGGHCRRWGSEAGGRVGVILGQDAQVKVLAEVVIGVVGDDLGWGDSLEGIEVERGRDQ